MKKDTSSIGLFLLAIFFALIAYGDKLLLLGGGILTLLLTGLLPIASAILFTLFVLNLLRHALKLAFSFLGSSIILAILFIIFFL